MSKLYNSLWQAVSGKLPASQIPVGFARTRYHGCTCGCNASSGDDTCLQLLY